MLELKKINKSFKKQKVLQDVSFSINENDICGFIGDNGAGKTTTIKCIFGEVRFDSGEILLNKKNIFDGYNLQDLYFFPDSNNIPLDLTVDEFVNYTALIKGMDEEQVRKDKKEIYKILDMENHAGKKLKNLSAGLKKKSIMCCCLVLKPKILILDEPTANLDIETKNLFIKILRKLNSIGVTIMITSHLIDELQDLINKLIIIKEGKIIYENKFDGTKEKILDIYNKNVDVEEKRLEIINEIYK